MAIGAIGYRSNLRLIDMVGLTDNTIAHTPGPFVGIGLPGHERFNSEYVLNRRPRFIVLLAVHNATSPIPAVRDMWFNHRFRSEYEWNAFVFERRRQ